MSIWHSIQLFPPRTFARMGIWPKPYLLNTLHTCRGFYWDFKVTQCKPGGASGLIFNALLNTLWQWNTEQNLWKRLLTESQNNWIQHWLNLQGTKSLLNSVSQLFSFMFKLIWIILPCHAPNTVLTNAEIIHMRLYLETT